MDTAINLPYISSWHTSGGQLPSFTFILSRIKEESQIMQNHNTDIQLQLLYPHSTDFFKRY